MKKMQRGLVNSLIILAVVAAIFSFAPVAVAVPTADNLGVIDYICNQGTNIWVPVDITNTQDGPIISISFDISYDSSVIDVVEIQKGDLTSFWDAPTTNDFAWGTRVSIVYDGNVGHAIQNGSTGSIVKLNFSAIGEDGEQSGMNFSNIELADTEYNTGTAMQAKNGIFHVVVLPTATNFGVDDTNGYKNKHVLIPVNVTNVQNGPVPCIKFDIIYDNSVINVTDVQKGTLTSDWETPEYYNHDWGTAVAIFYDSVDEHAIQNGSTGSVVLLNFSVIGDFGETSEMDFTNIQLAEGHPNYQIGTAPAKNGTFTVLFYGTINGQLTDITGTEIEGVTVTLKVQDSGIVLDTTTANETGYFSLNDLETGDYYVNFTKPRYWDNSSLLTVESGEQKTVNTILWRKGDLNENGHSADVGDLAMMKDATVDKITSDWKFDLNANGHSADVGDLAMMKDATVDKIELL